MLHNFKSLLLLLFFYMLSGVQKMYAQQTGKNDTIQTLAIIYDGDTLELGSAGLVSVGAF